MNFYEFAIPAQLDGEQLKAHLGADEVYIRDSKLVIGSSTLTLDQVTAGLATYVYVAPVDPNAAIKASIGAKLSANPVQPLSPAEVTWLASAIQ